MPIRAIIETITSKNCKDETRSFCKIYSTSRPWHMHLCFDVVSAADARGFIMAQMNCAATDILGFERHVPISEWKVIHKYANPTAPPDAQSLSEFLS